MALTLLQWNARSLVRKSSEFQTYLGDTLPSVVGVCETWLLPHLDLRLPGYSIYRRDRPQGRGGGLLLAFRDGLNHSPLPLPPWPGGSLEVIAARIRLLQGYATVAVFYNPGGATLPEFNHYLSSLPAPTLIIGDFNAHHQHWEPGLPPHRKNASGTALFQAILDSPRLTLLSPPGLDTWFHPYSGTSSVLDLLIGDPCFSSCTVTRGPYMGSDHLPLMTTIPHSPPPPTPGCLPRWKITSSSWPRFQEALRPIDDSLPLEAAATSLHSVLVSAGEATFPCVTRRTPRRPGKPWWNDDCAQAVSARRRAWAQYRRTPTAQAGREYHQLDAQCARIILKAQRGAWGSHCSSLSFSSPVKRTWDFLHSMEGKKIGCTVPLTDNNRQPLDDQQKAEVLAAHFHQQIGVPPLLHSPDDLHQVLRASADSPSPPALLQAFTDQELTVALSTFTTGKAAGHDTIPYDFLTHLPPPVQTNLLRLYNTSWQTARFPTCWKPSILLPIPKPGKDLTLPSSYRPIALLSCVGKVMERLVATRLSWWLEEHRLLQEEQCGFRPRRGTLDVLSQLEYHICDTYRHRQVMLTLFIDIAGAFDSAPHLGILYKLARMGITGSVQAWVANFLSDRTFRVAVGASMSTSHPIHRGVPQGSILSPLLFNILLSDLRVPPTSQLLIYADDITIVTRAPSLPEAQAHLQTAADMVADWFATWGLRVSPPKSSLMCFTLRTLPTLPSVNLDGQVVPYTTSHTFLGLHLDGPRLTWAGHVEYLRTSCTKRLAIMKRLTGVRWGADRSTLLRYYQTTIRAKLLYGSSIYGSASRTQLTKLDPIQHAALRISMGAMNSSPVLALHAESAVLPLSTSRKETLCHHYHRILTLPPNHPLPRLYADSGVDQRSPVWRPGSRQPLFVRAILALLALGLPPPPPQPIHPHSPLPPWLDLSPMFRLRLPGFPIGHSGSLLAVTLFTQMDRSLYHDHIKLFTDGSHSPSPLSTAAAVYDQVTSICRTWRLPPETNVLTSELFALYQALLHLLSHHAPGRAVIYTDSLSSLHLLLSRRPSSTTALAHTIQRLLLRLPDLGWTVTFQWVPSHTGIRGNEIADAAAKMALDAPDITPFPQPLSVAKRLISAACRSAWDVSLGPALRITSMGAYRQSSSPQPWIRRSSRVLDVALTRLRLGHTRLTAHLHRLHLSPDPHCPWCLTVPETIDHFMLHCPRFHTPRVILRSQLAALQINTFDLPTLLAAAGVPQEHRPTVIRLTCAFLRKTGQLSRL